MLSLGIDVGSSSVKVSIYSHDDGAVVSSGQFPDAEMQMIAPRPGWAEQEPKWWWFAFKQAYRRAIHKQDVDTRRITAIGIAYQMHGLVCLDKNGTPLRPSIIWCDSRAVEIGQKALDNLGEEYAFNHLLNSPGNFTASKLRWVQENEPEIFQATDKICLPGDYIGLKLTNRLTMTITGLSEGIFFDFQKKTVSEELLRNFNFDMDLLPEAHPSFADHGTVSAAIAGELGLSPKARVTYKAGDQPNNALSLNVLNPGEVAATAGTSGVVYGVSDSLFIDYSQRVNSFAHVNYTAAQPRIGVLLCINGTGIANAWAHKWTRADSYAVMNDKASRIPAGCEGLTFFPFGNGAERMLGNANTGAQLRGLNFNVHVPAHLYRSVQEGVAFAFIYGMEAFEENQMPPGVIRAGYANMFISPLFTQTLATLAGVDIELFNTDGSVGAARGALVGARDATLDTVFETLQKVDTYSPDYNLRDEYLTLYHRWKEQLLQILNEDG